MTRSQRRHHADRIKQKARAMARRWGVDAYRLYHSRTPCSCESCGNPRRWAGELTLQERKFECEGGEP